MRPTPLLRWGNALLKLELFERAAQPPRSAATHEMRETLKLWGGHAPVPAEEPIIAEILKDLGAAPALVAGTEADSAALEQARQAGIRTVVVKVTPEEASAARARVARELGLLTSHASAAAAVYAFEHGGVAIVSGVGEHEFSIEQAP